MKEKLDKAITKEVVHFGQRLWGPEFKQLALRAVRMHIISQVLKVLLIEHWYFLQHYIAEHSNS